MNETYVTVVGNLTADPRSSSTRNGDPFVSFRVAVNERRRDADGSFVDGHTSFYSVTCFRQLARNVRHTLRQGSRVVVTGKLRIKEWTTSERTGMSAEIDATSVAPDLAWGYADLYKGAAPPLTADRTEEAEIRAVIAELEGRVDLSTGELYDDGPTGDGEPVYDDHEAVPQGA